MRLLGKVLLAPLAFVALMALCLVSIPILIVGLGLIALGDEDRGTWVIEHSPAYLYLDWVMP